MSKGTPSNGKKNKRNHTTCCRCGSVSFHKQKGKCSSCAYPEKKMKKMQNRKAMLKKTTGTGKMRHMKKERISRRAGYPGNPILKEIRNKIKS
uniref:eL37 LJJ n=1 Tax=Spraguea lophii (strain 42_110) TaxID=1358809 RepID=UPI0022656F47|nr:Chain LJJ, eL37 LJJ [Spraguea lophii 42_110]7QJH_KJJ Chain KJJ, eL37 [Spraguea lophii 42_110]7QJH_LJJ Chain LJJ, eL37 [Spraguea lophii 42_110]8BR3_LJJ Chain LJJ, eL37 [Spraguea lophii 42_110]8P5D_LJJ Chain LJJ, eL37 [Spraguea lophii 42_110]8P60_KJJ Chain KJJ, 60S ribosomal protein L37 [Spraguea lophii 42_110]8P60_LJJ Chain LJJ, 60S ribosomal protein L37 [Spraguea lophii 42_110]